MRAGRQSWKYGGRNRQKEMEASVLDYAVPSQSIRARRGNRLKDRATQSCFDVEIKSGGRCKGESAERKGMQSISGSIFVKID